MPSGRGRLPVWVVRIRLSLFFTAAFLSWVKVYCGSMPAMRACSVQIGMSAFTKAANEAAGR